MKLQTNRITLRAFTLVETLLMLLALAVFSLTSLAVLKKDHFSLSAVLAKFNETNPVAPSASAPVSKPAAKPMRASPAVAAPTIPESAKAGSPAPVAKP